MQPAELCRPFYAKMNDFEKTLAGHNLQLTRARTTTLQVNVGYLCNMACKHCHVEAGPARTEVMTRQAMDEVLRFARLNSFSVIDITGGAPELIPDIGYLLSQAAALAPKVMMRTNLVALMAEESRDLLELCRSLKTTLVASFPSMNQGQTDSLRGSGVWKKSVTMLQRLNDLGYGRPGTGLDLFLVSNPAGAFLPADQCTAEQKFKADLAQKWGIEFSGLFTFANIPLGRFKTWLEKSGNHDAYMDKLSNGFNPTTVEGLMCRTLINISWDGYLYDCDFNLAAGLPFSDTPVHISDIDHLEEGTPVMTGTYCFACTAGSGFT